jgi:hypothetical protein
MRDSKLNCWSVKDQSFSVSCKILSAGYYKLRLHGRFVVEQGGIISLYTSYMFSLSLKYTITILITQLTFFEMNYKKNYDFQISWRTVRQTTLPVPPVVKHCPRSLDLIPGFSLWRYVKRASTAFPRS